MRGGVTDQDRLGSWDKWNGARGKVHEFSRVQHFLTSALAGTSRLDVAIACSRAIFSEAIRALVARTSPIISGPANAGPLYFPAHLLVSVVGAAQVWSPRLFVPSSP